jgi:uncharacterized damage-inducible protein DinB
MTNLVLAKQMLAQTRHSLERHHFPRIERCLAMLTDQEIWWRPHATSNSIGNLVLHLAGNVRQWIIAGLGGAPDRRERDQEFRARGPIPRRPLQAQLRKTVKEACGVIGRLTVQDLQQVHLIQGFRVTGLEALQHVTEHFAYHTGQIILITKMKRRKDLGFTRLPGEKRAGQRGRNLPAL